MPDEPLPSRPEDRAPFRTAGRFVAVLCLLFVFLVGVNGLGDGFKTLGADLLDAFFRATENPFMGLVVGILATTLVQSSSVTTALIVGLVAAPEHALPLANAVPMVMGANIGTTVTNTLVSMAHMGRKAEFYRAFSVATCHDFFNFLAVGLLLPLEIATGFLRRAATWLSGHLGGWGGVEYESPLKAALKAVVRRIEEPVLAAAPSDRWAAVILILLSGLLIYVALLLLVRTMRALMESRVESMVGGGLYRSPVVAMLIGILATVMVQSSSITTSLLVPLAGAGLLTLEQAFPITVGANIGTTVTALLASAAVTGPNARWGLTIALVHLLFNVTATAIILPTDRLRRIPLRLARRLAGVAVRSRRWALLYVIGLFYGLPAVLALLDHFL
ncbi:MAG: Na/Pi symporter [Gemmatimonadota bacterium]|nr:Na/Pi symporter [Gemmatimonadota bacterium]